ncbi:hypothetical protein PMSD_01795 [Paenibacillus macquariensis subsp. defensor]|nr:hypothetical protein PMSD_01795 [Paenibacillus macquariensis subsp. defensor]
MKKPTKILFFTFAMSLFFTTGASAFSAMETNPSKVTASETSATVVQFTNKGEIPYGEFIRAVVIEISGQKPQIMDTHYAMPYIKEAKELGLIGDVPMKQWSQNITHDEMNAIIAKMAGNQKENVIKQVNALLVDSITLNGSPLDLGGLKMTVRNGNVMVPLRIVVEALGFNVTWEKNPHTALIDNGTIKTSLQIGYDNYYKASSNQIGLTEPIQYGTPPMLFEGNTYVPAQLINLLLSDTDSIIINGGVLNIISK